MELLIGPSATVTFSNCQGVIKANYGDVGYYRTSYSPEMFERLKQQINSLPPADRLNLLADTWAMVAAGRATAANYLDLAASLHNEKTTAIWQEVLGRLGFMDTLERGRPGRAAFRARMIQLVQPQLERLGWDAKPNEPATDSLLRNSVITLLGDFGDQAVIAEARARFKQFLAQPNSLPPNLRPCVINLVGRYSDRATYDQLHALARAAKGTEERKRGIRAMASALDPSLAALTLPISLTDETVPQEAILLVRDVAHSGEQPELAWAFAQEHMTQLLARTEEFERTFTSHPS